MKLTHYPNLLIYAVNEDAPLNRKAKSWLESVLSGPESIGLPWNALLAFLRLTTRRGLFRRPLSLAAAFDVIGAWLNQPCVVVVHPGTRHFHVLRELLAPLGTGGNLTSDADLAALAIEKRSGTLLVRQRLFEILGSAVA